jgi:hypothetical protein
MPRMTLLVALALAVSPYTIQADRAVGPLRIGNATLSEARSTYGEPTTIRYRPNTCIARWRPLRLALFFLSFDSDPCTSGALIFATAASKRWRTNRGLRVGNRRARLRALYPQAKAHRDGWWLITRRACQEVGGNPFPALKTQMRNRRVTAFAVSASVCE